MSNIDEIEAAETNGNDSNSQSQRLTMLERERRNLRLFYFIPNIIASLPTLTFLGLAIWQFVEAANAKKKSREFDDHMGWGSGAMIFFLITLVCSCLCWGVRHAYEGNRIGNLNEQIEGLRNEVNTLTLNNEANPTEEDEVIEIPATESAQPTPYLSVRSFIAKIGDCFKRDNNPQVLLLNDELNEGEVLSASNNQNTPK